MAAQPSISFGPVNETPKPSGRVLGREFYSDSAGRTILGNTVTDQMGGGSGAPGAPSETCGCVCADMASTYTVTTADGFLTGPVVVTADGGANEGCHWFGTDGGNTVDLALVDDTTCYWILSINEGITFLFFTLDECSPIGTYANLSETLHAVVS